MAPNSEPDHFQRSLALAKARDFVGARQVIELLDGTHAQRMAYILLLANQVRAGDLAGTKETVHAAPALWTGGHWVRCLVGPLVKTGDLSGALDIVARLTGATNRAFHKRVIVAHQATAGDLQGARDTAETISPEEGHRDGALGIICEALVRRGDFRTAVETAYGMADMDIRAETIGTILAAQVKAQGAVVAEQTIGKIVDEAMKNQALAVMEETISQESEPVDLLSVWRISMCVNDTFDTLYPEN